jgi:hypothetical protein
MWLNLILLTPCGEPGFAFWLMALLSHQQLLCVKPDQLIAPPKPIKLIAPSLPN